MGAASQELTERAKLLISERRYQEAVRACRRALLSQPGQIEIRLLLGEALLALERYDEVRVEMIALARKAPERASVHRLLGEAYLRDGRPTQAIESLRRALNLDPHDEVAEELIAEAAEETAPVSTTIERWFADEAEPTVETESPAWQEVSTPVPGATHPPELIPVEPSVQIDPSLVEEALGTRPKTSPARPAARVRSRKPTIAGAGIAPPVDAPLPPPPGAGDAPPRAKLGPRPAAPPSAPPPPRPERPRAPTSNLPPSRAPSARPPVPRPSPFASSFRPSENTNAAKPSAMRSPVPEPQTDELSLEELVSDDLSPVPYFEGEPTRAAPDHEPIFRNYPTEDIEDDELLEEDDSPTLAWDGDLPPRGAHQAQLEAIPTRANRPAAPSPLEPPTVDHFPPPRYESTPYADPEEIETRPGPSVTAPPLSGEETPALPSGSQHLPTARTRPRSRQWILPALTGGFALIVLAVVVAFGVNAWMSSSEKQEIRAASAAALDSGSREEIEAVVEQIGDSDDEELLALKARLLGTLTYEHGLDHATEVRELVNSVTAPEATTDARIAAALYSLSQGQPDEAQQRLLGLEAQGEQIPEAFRARALVMAAKGAWTEARDAAREAVTIRPSAPRHIALHALTDHMTGRSDSALTLLEGTPGAQNEPAVRVVRARILADTGSDPAQAVQEASAVIDELSARATPGDLAWAHLIRAAEGEPAQALEEARAAAERSPPLDEAFQMRLVRVFLERGANEEADRQLTEATESVPPIDAPGRALLTAEVALAVGDLGRADEALGNAGSGNAQDLLRARLFEARGQTEAARPLYERVMNQPGPAGRRAAVRLAAIEYQAGHSDRVIEILEERRDEAVDDPELVPLLARAYLERDRAGDARRIVEAALRRRPGSPRIEAVRGAVLLAQGDAEGALAPLTAAAAASPEDARLQADLGLAAERTANLEQARAAYAAALEQDPQNPRALVGLARMDFAADEFDRAQERVDAAAATDAEALAVAQLRARLYVVRGAGQVGVDTVRTLARAHRDPTVWTALGDLFLQAEQDSGATRAYAEALEIDEHYVEALLGQAFMHIRAGNRDRARELLDSISESARETGRERELRPRIEVMHGWQAYEDEDWEEARQRANQAIELDENLSSAHLLLGSVAIEQRQDPVPHLQRAAAAQAPLPEALGQLVPRLAERGEREEACRIGRRYLSAAPRGFDASAVRSVVRRCQ